MDADLLKYTFLANALLITEHQLTGRTERGGQPVCISFKDKEWSGAEERWCHRVCQLRQVVTSISQALLFTASSGHDANVVQVKCTVTSAGHLPSIIGRRESRD